MSLLRLGLSLLVGGALAQDWKDVVSPECQIAEDALDNVAVYDVSKKAAKESLKLCQEPCKKNDICPGGECDDSSCDFKLVDVYRDACSDADGTLFTFSGSYVENGCEKSFDVISMECFPNACSGDDKELMLKFELASACNGLECDISYSGDGLGAGFVILIILVILLGVGVVFFVVKKKKGGSSGGTKV